MEYEFIEIMTGVLCERSIELKNDLNCAFLYLTLLPTPAPDTYWSLLCSYSYGFSSCHINGLMQYALRKHPGTFYFLAIVNEAAMNSCIFLLSSILWTNSVFYMIWFYLHHLLFGDTSYLIFWAIVLGFTVWTFNFSQSTISCAI